MRVIELRGEMITFDEFCASVGIYGDTKLYFELWLKDISARTATEWANAWMRYKRIVDNDPPRRAGV